MSFYRRRLPHWQRGETVLFVTWRLYGTLPRKRRQWQPDLNGGEAFVAWDRQLDKAEHGPSWLKDPHIAQCVEDAFHFGEKELGLYELRDYVVMPNHVHLLIKPFSPLARITRVIKGFTARKANKILQRTGKPFWQDESFDHWVRSDSEFERIVRYIENNPVAAGLVGKAEDWHWSSAGRRAGKNACPTGF